MPEHRASEQPARHKPYQSALACTQRRAHTPDCSAKQPPSAHLEPAVHQLLVQTVQQGQGTGLQALQVDVAAE